MSKKMIEALAMVFLLVLLYDLAGSFFNGFNKNFIRTRTATKTVRVRSGRGKSGKGKNKFDLLEA